MTTPLAGRTLAVVRALWIAIAVLVFVLVVTGLPLRYEMVRTGDPNLRVPEFSDLIPAGVNPDVAATLDLTTGMFGFLALLIGGVILYQRASTSREASFLSLVLIVGPGVCGRLRVRSAVLHKRDARNRPEGSPPVGAALLLALLGAVGCSGDASAPTLVLATTTSVANSGLLDALSHAYRAQTTTVIRAHLVGSGLALRMLEKGDVDVAISHAPETEAQFLTAHPNWRYRKIMYNDFVLVGPPSDPATVHGADRASDAMQRIAESQVKFISRGDGSGTHEREEQLWRSAGRRPHQAGLVAAGAGMSTTLRIASETGSYTLTDRATLAQYAGTLSLIVVFEGGAELLNTYAVVVDATGSHANEAERFSTWLVNGAGRHVISEYRIRGVPVFTVWPPVAPHGRPDDKPRNE